MLNRKDAEQLLFEAREINPGKWVEHSFYVAVASERLATHLGLDAEKAYIYGLLHDIGRIKKGIGLRHVVDGYYYMKNLGHPAIARYCLTHTFFIKDIHSSCALWDITLEEGEEMQTILNSYCYDMYDKIIQIADHIGDASGFVTIERRLIDVHLRKGVDENTIKTWNAIFATQLEIEEKLQHSIYKLFPEIGMNLQRQLVKDYLTLK